MPEQFAVIVDGLEGLPKYIEGVNDAVALNAARAVNKTAERYRKAAAEEIRRQINLPESYVSPNAGRLSIVQTASRAEPEAIIRARGRRTSLAQFVTSAPAKRGLSVHLSVVPGRSIELKKAFLIRLRSGTADLDTRSNTGLAVRLGPNDTLRNKKQAIRMKNGLYLLYGPSVAQVLVNNEGGGVAADLSEGISAFLKDEFERLQGVFT
jgi:hypothetical protein